MDVFTALQTSISGLRAQSYSLNNISGNIANSQTAGFKRVDTNFVDLIAEQSPRHETAGNVAAFADLTNSIQGNVVSTGVGTNMALSGQGFFVVRKKTTDATGGSAFGSGDMYTRRGDFGLDKDGFFVNGAGSYLVGSTIDPITGQQSTNGPIRVGNEALPAKPTSSITYAASLPKTPATANTSTVAGSELLGNFRDGTNATIKTGTGTATVPVANAQQLIDNSIAGPALTAYTSVGAPVGLQMRWAKVQNADVAAGTSDTWNLFYADKNNVGGAETSWTNVGSAFAFDGNGKLTAPAGTSVTIPGLTVDGASFGDVAINFGQDGGLTQYPAVTGGVTTNTLQQNGYASGSLKSIAVSEEGKITGTYSNGTTLNLATVNVAQFNNVDGLKPDSLGNFLQTTESGSPTVGLGGSVVIGGNVEQSNTDIASEFSKMIVTQQAYSANTRVLSTAQTMISDLLNVIR